MRRSCSADATRRRCSYTAILLTSLRFDLDDLLTLTSQSARKRDLRIEIPGVKNSSKALNFELQGH